MVAGFEDHMTRKLYAAIAAELRPLTDKAEDRITGDKAVKAFSNMHRIIELRLMRSVVIRLANVFKAHNPAFSRERFYVACGFDADIQ